MIQWIWIRNTACCPKFKIEWTYQWNWPILFLYYNFYPTSSSNIKSLPSLSSVTWQRTRCAINLQESDPDPLVRGSGSGSLDLLVKLMEVFKCVKRRSDQSGHVGYRGRLGLGTIHVAATNNKGLGTPGVTPSSLSQRLADSHTDTTQL